MTTCPSCGAEVASGSRFCAQCGAAVAASAEAGARKIVSIVFSDLVGSTVLGEHLDPESLRALLRRYFAEMQAVLESHGGRVEKFIGDAVMAVFGVPAAHEDDALRAVRAAAHMRARLAVLNDELERDFRVRLASRTGVNTGEIVAGDATEAQGFVSGDAVNVGARELYERKGNLASPAVVARASLVP